MASKDDADQLLVEQRFAHCCSPMMTTSSHGKDFSELNACSTAMSDSFHGGATHSERSDDPSTESRMCTEESIERMTSSTEGMVSLSDDSEDTHAEAHGIAGAACTRRDGKNRRATVAVNYHGQHGMATSSSANGIADAIAAAASASAAGHSPNLARDDTVDADEQSDEQGMNGMLGSYREISLEDDDDDDGDPLKDGRLKGGSSSVEAGDDTEEEVSNLSPDSALSSPQYADDSQQMKQVVFPDFEVAGAGAEARLADIDSLETPNQRPNSLQLLPSIAGGGARSKRPTSSSSTSGTSPGRWSSRYHVQNQEVPSTSRHRAERIVDVASSSHAGALQSSSAPTAQPLTWSASAISSSSASASSSSDMDGMFGALQGLILREGDMVSFVAEDLQEQIRRSSPVTRRGGTASFPGSRSSSPSLYKQAVTPQVMPIDPTVLGDVERHARSIAASVDTILQNLTGTLHCVSSLTVDCMESYHDSVCKTCDSMDSNIKAMYQLMAKTEELGNMMRPVHRLSSQIKDIKRLLSLLEHVAASSGSGS